MKYTIKELWAMLCEHKGEINSLKLLVLKARTERTEMQQRIDQLTKDNAWLVGSRKRHMDACEIKDAGLRCMSDTISWMFDNKRIF